MDNMQKETISHTFFTNNGEIPHGQMTQFKNSMVGVNSKVSDVPDQGSYKGWRLVWCHERCHKPENESRRHALSSAASQLGAGLVCFKKARRFELWIERSRRPTYALLTDWREAQPCMQAILKNRERNQPAYVVVLCDSGRQLGRAHQWAKRLPEDVGRIFICESATLPSTLFGGVLHKLFAPGPNGEPGYGAATSDYLGGSSNCKGGGSIADGSTDDFDDDDDDVEVNSAEHSWSQDMDHVRDDTEEQQRNYQTFGHASLAHEMPAFVNLSQDEPLPFHTSPFGLEAPFGGPRFQEAQPARVTMQSSSTVPMPWEMPMPSFGAGSCVKVEPHSKHQPASLTMSFLDAPGAGRAPCGPKDMQSPVWPQRYTTSTAICESLWGQPCVSTECWRL
jgi:hypothetical protein